MVVSTALQPLRLTARSVASAQLSRRTAASSASIRASSSSVPPGRRASQSTTKSQGHAPHGHLDHHGVAGPSRCFCSSHSNKKASELPLEELHYVSDLDSYRPGQLSSAEHFWQPTDTGRSPVRSTDALTPPRRKANDLNTNDPTNAASIDPLIRSEHSHSLQTTIDPTANNDFFTPSLHQTSGRHVVQIEPASNNIAAAIDVPQPYIDSLSPAERDALDDRVRLLIRSGEHSMRALTVEYGHLSPSDHEQVASHVMSLCLKDNEDARMVWELYRTWTPNVEAVHSLPPGPARSMLRRIQSGTIYNCCIYLHSAGMTRQAAMVVGDARLKPSQSRYLLERLVYELKVPSSVTANEICSTQSDPSASSSKQPNEVQLSANSFAAADTQLAVRQMCDSMTNLMADGVSFKRKTINRTFKLLCLTRARSRLTRLLRAAQRRAQLEATIDLAGINGGQSGEMRAAGGFSRLRTSSQPLPQVISTKVMEECIRLLCTQDSSGARTAYELLCALDPLQRSAAMYDALMTVYGNAPPDSHLSPVLEGAYSPPDVQLWRDVCTLPHLAGPTVYTVSARMVCHARTRRLDLVKRDLAFLNTARLGTLHDLTEHARLAVVRAHIESASLLRAFTITHSLLSHNPSPSSSFQVALVNTLLRAAQHIAIPSTGRGGKSAPSKAQLLKRFLRHFSLLHQRHPKLQLTLETLNLFIKLLESHKAWIESETLWAMLKVIAGHFRERDARMGRVLEAFANVFDARGESKAAEELRGLMERLEKKVQ